MRGGVNEVTAEQKKKIWRQLLKKGHDGITQTGSPSSFTPCKTCLAHCVHIKTLSSLRFHLASSKDFAGEIFIPRQEITKIQNVLCQACSSSPAALNGKSVMSHIYV